MPGRPLVSRDRASHHYRRTRDRAEVGVEFGEDLGHEDRVVGDIAGAIIRDRKGGGIAPDIHGADDRPRGSIDDGHGTVRMVSHIEQGAVRRQRAAPRLCAHLDVLHDPALGQVNHRDGAAHTIGDECFLVIGTHRDAARFFANADFGNLGADIVALHIFDSDD